MKRTAGRTRATAKPAAPGRATGAPRRASGLVAGAAAERQLRGFIAKFEPRLQRRIRAVRARLRRRLPTAHELVWDNYNFLVIGYSPNGRPYDSPFSLAAAANGVGIAFLQGASLPDPHRLLQGGGKQNRFLRLPEADVLDRPEVVELLDAAIARVKAPFAAGGRGPLVIRSISAKQRARRRAT